MRLTGDDRLVDVARKLFHDDRVLPLLMDLNPDLGPGRLSGGTSVVLPTNEEAQAFAAKMGFSLGFDPAKGGGTQAKRAWNKMKSGGAGQGAVSPEELSVVLHRQGLPAEKAAKRLAALVDPGVLEAFQRADHDDEGVAAIAAASRTLAARATLRGQLRALAGLLEASARPRGRRALLESAVEHRAEVLSVLAGLLVPEKVATAIADAGAHIAPHLARAESLAALDGTLRDVEIDAIPQEQGRDVLRTLVLAAVDGVELLASDRLALLGIASVVEALERHTGQVAGMLRKLVDLVDDARPDVVLGVVAGEAASLPKPWPVAATVVGRLQERIRAMHAGDQDRGIAGLVAPSSAKADTLGPTMSAAELAARAAANARVAEAHDGVPERLSSSMLTLFDPLRPSAPDTGSEAQQRQRRRARVERALLASRDVGVDGAVVAGVVEELLDLLPQLEDKSMRRRASRLGAPVRQGCLELARELTMAIPALLRDASPVARGLLVVGLALDPEVGPTLARSSGREAALALLKVHGTRAVTLTVQRYAGGPAPS